MSNLIKELVTKATFVGLTAISAASGATDRPAPPAHEPAGGGSTATATGGIAYGGLGGRGGMGGGGTGGTGNGGMGGTGNGGTGGTGNGGTGGSGTGTGTGTASSGSNSGVNIRGGVTLGAQLLNGGGDCPEGFALQFGTLDFAVGGALQGQDKFCLGVGAANSLMNAGIRIGDPFMVAAGAASFRKMFDEIEKGSKIVVSNVYETCAPRAAMITPMVLTEPLNCTRFNKVWQNVTLVFEQQPATTSMPKNDPYAQAVYGTASAPAEAPRKRGSGKRAGTPPADDKCKRQKVELQACLGAKL